ncbi:MAG: polyisoprenoid-binding protein, partial [Stenotrophomonas sp.]|nr:polyisoprenoid-binding protein [Stenotrophomonas sp.]
MSLARRSRFLLPALLALGPAWAAAPPPTPLPPVSAEAPRVLRLDTERSRIGFEVRTRFGQRIEGVFPHFEGRIE